MAETPLQHAATPHGDDLFRGRLLSGLNIAAFVTWLATSVAVMEFEKLRVGDPREWLGLGALFAFMALYVLCALDESSGRGRRVPQVITQGLFALLAEALLLGGQTSVLLIIVAGQLVLMLPLRGFLAIMIALNAGLALLWTTRGFSPGDTIVSLLQIGGFQAFAALTGHYAGSREQARRHLAEVNAELLATRRLLEESARAGERLKLSRELHDVAGHSLTALKLNLARLARDPALREREEIVLSTRLADDLLAQIRQVVGTLRAYDGLDLRAALETLGTSMPGVRVVIAIEDGLRVDDIDQAEVLLRCAQEAITNALRHGRASNIHIRLDRDADGLVLTVDNDGLAPERIHEGHGLTGMRERLASVGGTLSVAATSPRGLRLIAGIPTPASTTPSANPRTAMEAAA